MRRRAVTFPGLQELALVKPLTRFLREKRFVLNRNITLTSILLVMTSSGRTLRPRRSWGYLLRNWKSESMYYINGDDDDDDGLIAVGRECIVSTKNTIIIDLLCKCRLTRQDREHVPLMSSQQAGMDWQGSATQANKNMPSYHRTPDMQGKISGRK
jgi:hypothetical protein